MVTGSDDNKRIVQRWHDAWNTHDDSLLLQLADEIYAPDLIIHHPAPRPDERSLASWKQGVVAWIKDVPDIHVTLEDLFGEGNVDSDGNGVELFAPLPVTPRTAPPAKQ